MVAAAAMGAKRENGVIFESCDGWISESLSESSQGEIAESEAASTWPVSWRGGSCRGEGAAHEDAEWGVFEHAILQCFEVGGIDGAVEVGVDPI